MCIIRVPKAKETENRTETKSEEIKIEYFLKLMKDIKSHISEMIAG